MAFYVSKVVSGVTKHVILSRIFGEESLLCSHVYPFSLPYSSSLICFSAEIYNKMETYYLFMQLLGETKPERHIQHYLRGIELLLLYRSASKQYLQETE